MVNTVKSVFEDECRDVKIDARLVKRIATYRSSFLNRNEDHVAFFGGNLLGVYPIRFKSSDSTSWFDDILEVDDLSLRQRLHALPSIEPRYHVSSDIFNLSCLWLLHAIHNSQHLSAREKEIGMIEVMLILHYKFLSSLMAHNFPYPADKEVAVATYAALSKKYALKVHGSWSALLHARALDIVSSNSIHRQTIVKFDDDKAIVYMVNDIQGRIREVVKKMMAVFYTIKDQNARIGTTSSVLSTDGENIVRDKTRNISAYRRYLHDVIPDKATFIRDEVFSVITGSMHTMPPRGLLEALSFMSDNYHVTDRALRTEGGSNIIVELVDETLLHAFDFLSANRNILRQNDLGMLVSRLKAIYMSSRSSDPSLMKMRDLAEEIVRQTATTKNPSVIASIRTGILLYLVLRAFTMKYYT